MKRVIFIVVVALAGAACHVPAPFEPTTRPETVPPGSPAGGVSTTPVPSNTAPQPGQSETPTPAPVREPTLSPATKALVGQAQAQLSKSDYPLAAGSIERALRIEPNNPLLWTELGKVRLAEGNYPQAENMGHKAVALARNAPNAQSAAWKLIADSYRARGKNSEARDADAKAQELVRN